MGLTLSPDSSPLPTRFRGMFFVKKLVAGTYISYGPYTCRFVPITGQDHEGIAGHLIEAEERIFFPLYAPAQQNDTVRRLETNQAWTVLFATPIGAELEVWAKRSVVPVAGTKIL